MDFVTEWFWFFLFVPLAALAGWVIGRRGGQRHGDSQVSRLSSTYFRGLNYLLNEQPDKAIEVFLEIAEVDKGTVETHFALGNLFRRRAMPEAGFGPGSAEAAAVTSGSVSAARRAGSGWSRGRRSSVRRSMSAEGCGSSGER